MECTFAINSTAPGIVVIQDDQSQYTINKTLQRLQQDSDKGSVNITGLPAGEYSVRVYDNMEDKLENSTSPAYQHSLLQIIPLLPSPTPSQSTVATGTIMLFFLLSILTVYNLFYRHIHCCEFFCAYHSTQQYLSFHNTCFCSMYVYRLHQCDLIAVI